MNYDFEKSLTFYNFSDKNNNTKVYYNAGFRLSAAQAIDQMCFSGT